MAKKAKKKAAARTGTTSKKTRKAIAVKSVKAGKSAEALAAELGVSRPYIYVLKNKG